MQAIKCPYLGLSISIFFVTLNKRFPGVVVGDGAVGKVPSPMASLSFPLVSHNSTPDMSPHFVHNQCIPGK